MCSSLDDFASKSVRPTGCNAVEMLQASSTTLRGIVVASTPLRFCCQRLVLNGKNSLGCIDFFVFQYKNQFTWKLLTRWYDPPKSLHLLTCHSHTRVCTI